VVDTGRHFPGAEDADDTDGLTRVAFDTLLALPDVTRVGLALIEGGGRRLRFTAGDRDRAHAVDWCLIDAYDDVPLTTVVRTGRPVIGSLDALEHRYAGVTARLRRQSVVALAALPLVDGGPPLGGVVLFYRRQQGFDRDQLAELSRHATGLAALIRRLQAVAPTMEPGAEIVPELAGERFTSTVVDGDPRAVGEARRHLRRALAGWGLDRDLSDTAVLCLSELVTNAVIHTGAPSEVRATLDGGVLTVSVSDRGVAGRRPQLLDGSPDPLRVHGRGLQMVGALADRWGSEVDAAGTTAWFALETGREEFGARVASDPSPPGPEAPGAGQRP
jgi:anti-sigma regulatory factor (Ser/Thr protein kinase)